MITVAIVDDHPIVWKGLKAMLAAILDIHLAGEGACMADALRIVVAQGEKWLSICAYANLSYQFETLAKAAGAEAFVSEEDLDLEPMRSWTEAF